MLITVENRSPRLDGTGESSSFGPVSSFQSNLSRELVLSPGSKVTLKRAQFLMNADTFIVNGSNKSWAFLVGYDDAATAAPTDYSVVGTHTSGVLLRGDLREGYYSGEKLAEEIERSLNEVLSGYDLFAAKQLRIECQYLEDLSNKATPPQFTLAMVESINSVQTYKGFPDAWTMFTDVPQSVRTANVTDFVIEDGKGAKDVVAHRPAPPPPGTAFISAFKVAKTIRLEQDPTSTDWTAALNACAYVSVSPLTTAYGSLAIPDATNNTTEFKAGQPIRPQPGTNPNVDNIFALPYIHSVKVFLISRSLMGDFTFNNANTAALETPLSTLNIDSGTTEGIALAAELLSLVTPELDSANQCTGSVNFQIETEVNTDLNQNNRTTNLSSFNAYTSTTQIGSSMVNFSSTGDQLISGFTGPLPTQIILSCLQTKQADGSVRVTLSANGVAGTVTETVGALPNASTAVFDYNPDILVPFVALVAGFTTAIAGGSPIPPAAGETSSLVPLWYDVEGDFYKVSTALERDIQPLSEWGYSDLITAFSNISPSLGTHTEPVGVLADDGTTVLTGTAEVEWYNVANLDVSHVGPNADFDFEIASIQWNTLLHWFGDQIRNAASANEPWVAPIRIEYNGDVRIVYPFQTNSVVRGQLYADSPFPINRFVPATDSMWPHLTVDTRFRKAEGSNLVSVSFPFPSFTGYDTLLRTAPIVPTVYAAAQIEDAEVSTEPVVYHAANLRSSTPLVTYHGDLARYRLGDAHEPNHANSATDSLIGLGDSLDPHVADDVTLRAQNANLGNFLYFQGMWDLLGFYIPGLNGAAPNQSWLNLTPAVQYASNVNPSQFRYQGIAVHVRNLPITSYQSNGQVGRILEFIDDLGEAQSTATSREIDGVSVRVYSLDYVPSDPAVHELQISERISLTNLDFMLTDFSGRLLQAQIIDSQQGKFDDPILQVSLTLEFNTPNPLLEQLVYQNKLQQRGAGSTDGNPLKRPLRM